MKSTTNRTSPARAGMTALLIAPLMFSCSSEATDPSFVTEDISSEQAPAGQSAGLEIEKRKDCVYIDQCEPVVICITLSKIKDPTCTLLERTNECFRDAAKVCGDDHKPIIERPPACQNRCGGQCPCP